MAPQQDNKPKRRRALFAIVLAIIAIVALRVHDLNRQATRTPNYDTVRPFRGTFVRTVPVAGEIRNYKPIVVHSDVRAWERPRVIEMVAPGTFVKKGEPVMILDASEFRKKLTKPTLAVIADNARYDKAQADEIIQEGNNSRRTEATRFDAEMAQRQLTSYTEGDYVNQKARLEGSIKQRTQSYEQTLAEFRETQRLSRAGIVSNTAVTAAQRDLEKTQIDLSLAKGDVSLLDQFQHPRSMAQLGMAAEISLLEVERTQLRNQLDTSIKKTWTLSFDKYRTGWQRQVDYWQSCVDACIVRAPKDGQVMYLNEHDKIIAIGETVHYKQALFTVSERTRLSMAGRVSDRHFFLLRRTQEANIKVPALADRQFSGKLTWMGTIPTVFSRLAPESKHHKIEILLDGRGKTISNLYPGMTATAEIIVDSREDVLMVPTGGVIHHEGEYVAVVQTPTGIARRVIEVGATDDAYTEITAGLELTDEVVVALPETLRDLVSESVR